MLEALVSEQYKQRLEKVHRFEEISGGGMLKRVQHLLVAPSLYLPYLLYAKAGMSRWFWTTTTLFWGRQIRIPLKDYDALILLMYGGLYGDELKFTQYLIKNLGPNDVFYDIGANFGFYTYLAADLCRETHSFEPMPWLADVVKGNIRKNDTITVNATALSDTSGTTDFYITDASAMVSTINPSVVAQYASLDTHTFKNIRVPTMTLDAYVATHTKPTFMKIDAEGAEEQIIRGGRDFFAANAPVIAMEVWGKGNEWELSMRAVDMLRNMGYQSYRLDTTGAIQKVDGDLSSLLAPRGGEDFIFKKSGI